MDPLICCQLFAFLYHYLAILLLIFTSEYYISDDCKDKLFYAVCSFPSIFSQVNGF